MDDERWLEIALGIAALGGAVFVGLVAQLAELMGRAPTRAGDERPERGGKRRSVRGILDPQRSWFLALDGLLVALIALATALLTVGLGAPIGSAGALVAVAVVVVAHWVLVQALAQAMLASQPQACARLVNGAGSALGFLARPFVMLLAPVVQLLGRIVPDAPGAAAPSGREDDFRALIADGDDMIEADERQMIDGILHLEEVRVRDIMVPRVDIVAVERSMPAREIVATIIRAGHSRIPVYQESIDRIVGVLYAKDLLPFVIGSTEALPLVSMLRPPYVVPESKKVDDLLDELRRTKIHLAVVADEYGGTAGIVTIEDILEEIVGEIQDEYDREVPLFEIVGEQELVADGRLAVEDVEDTLDVQFEDDDYGTLGGFVQKHLGRLPQEGDQLQAEGVGVEVIEVERHRVRKMRIWRLDDGATQDGDGTLQVDPVAIEAKTATDDRP